ALAVESRLPFAVGVQTMTVEERLTKLEKSLRKWRYLSLALTVASVALAGGVAYEFLGVRGTVRARRLIVVNDRGMAFDLDSTTDGDGIISVHDSMNVPRVRLG